MTSTRNRILETTLARTRKRILTLDFDGVIHSYTSGWKGVRKVADPPVPGALNFIVEAMADFDIAILSSRSHVFGGRRAMKNWLRRHVFEAMDDEHGHSLYYKMAMAAAAATMEPWDTIRRDTARVFVCKKIRWPIFKPTSHVSIDDRGLNFDGTWPDIETLQAFRPWNKR